MPKPAEDLHAHDARADEAGAFPIAEQNVALPLARGCGGDHGEDGLLLLAVEPLRREDERRSAFLDGDVGERKRTRTTEPELKIIEGGRVLRRIPLAQRFLQRLEMGRIGQG